MRSWSLSSVEKAAVILAVAMDIDTTDDERGGVLALGAVSLVAGAATGLVGAVFRVCLERGNELRDGVVGWAGGVGFIGFAVVVVGCACAAAVAAWLVRRFSPHAAGSGIPHVEAVLGGRLRPAPLVLIPVKFAGGVLAIGAGMALGREGPSVQIGSSIAQLCGKLFDRNWADVRVLMAAGAGAGLATAFNAPMAGAIFVLEELVRRFETRIAIAALGASATAMAVARLFLGDAPEFQVAALPYSDLQTRVLFLALGIVAGVVGVAYNYTLVGAIRGFGRLERWPVELRAGAVGGLVGIVACFAPKVVGGGEALAQQTFDGMFALRVLPLVLVTRFFLGPISYAARTPGGLFAPMLVVGAQLGLLFGVGCHQVLPGLVMPNEAFAVVGMAAFFTAVVRAPITGITLIIEMTGSIPMLLPMLFACFAAMLAPTLLGNRPIYESLREKA
jgi:CIC family chloride channel protein